MVRIIYMSSDDPRNHFAGPGWFIWYFDENRFNGPFVTFKEAQIAAWEE